MKIQYELVSVEEIPHSIEYKVCIKVNRVPSWYNRLFGNNKITTEEKTYIGYSSWREIPSLDIVDLWTPLEDFLEDAIGRFETLQEYSKCR